MEVQRMSTGTVVSQESVKLCKFASQNPKNHFSRRGIAFRLKYARLCFTSLFYNHHLSQSYVADVCIEPIFWFVGNFTNVLGPVIKFHSAHLPNLIYQSHLIYPSDLNYRLSWSASFSFYPPSYRFAIGSDFPIGGRRVDRQPSSYF